jgi:hypothetical protein
MNYQPNPYMEQHYDLASSAQGERIIPLLTGFALGAPFWSGRYRVPYPYPYYYPYPYAYPYPYQYYRPFRRRRRWY